MNKVVKFLRDNYNFISRVSTILMAIGVVLMIMMGIWGVIELPKNANAIWLAAIVVLASMIIATTLAAICEIYEKKYLKNN